MGSQFRGSTRRQRLPGNWSRLRAQVLRRDNYTCSVLDCNQVARDIDHKERGDDHSLSNLQALCPYHHKVKTSKEGNEVRWKKERELREKFSRTKDSFLD